MYVSLCTRCTPTAPQWLCKLINDWSTGFECWWTVSFIGEVSDVCFSLCLTMLCVEWCLLACACVLVCVYACFPGDQQFISLLQWHFSLQITRKVEMGLFSGATTPSGALSTTNNCHFELQGLHFLFVSLDSWLIFLWWPISAYSDLKLWCNSLMKYVHLKKTQNVKKKQATETPQLPLRVWFDLYPFPSF